MKRNPTLLRLGIAALICLGGLAWLNSSIAQNVNPLPGKDQPQIQIAQPPNGPPIKVE
jgi:hypothetical protein